MKRKITLFALLLVQVAIGYAQPKLKWGSYFGGPGGAAPEEGFSITTDSKGNIYMCGQTASDTKIATPGAFEETFKSGSGEGTDVYLAKFDKDGNQIWGTYFGGYEDDFGYTVTCDDSDNVFIAGLSSSAGLATPGAHQTTPSGGGFLEPFLAKFNAEGQIQWSTYYGGNNGSFFGNEYFTSVACDADGNVYAAGVTNSTNNIPNAIATPNAYQTTLNSGGSNNNNTDGFIVKFNRAGVRQWGTYYGGDESDYINGITCLPDGSIAVGGFTSSSAHIASANAHQVTYGDGGSDAFVAKFKADGTRQWGTYYGGEGFEMNDGKFNGKVIGDREGNVYFSSVTQSETNIATSGTHQFAFGGFRDAFLVKFNGEGTRKWATYYGGTELEAVGGLAIDERGKIIISGGTSSAANIVKGNAHQSTYGGSQDGFIAIFNNSNGMLDWGTYYGGNSGDIIYQVATSGRNLYFTGTTHSATNIATTGAHQEIMSNWNDAFFGRFIQPIDIKVADIITPAKDTLCADSVWLSFSFQNSSEFNIGDSMFVTAVINPGNITIDTILTQVLSAMGADTVPLVKAALIQEGTYTIQTYIRKLDGDTLAANDTLIHTIEVLNTPSVAGITATGTGNVYNFSATTPENVATYSWDFGDNSTGSNAETPSHTYANDGSYTVTLIVSNGYCSDTTTTQVSITTGINSIEKESFVNIYPNPATDRLIIENKDMRAMTGIAVLNSLGAVVHTQAVNNGKSCRVETGQWAAGLYMIQINYDNRTITKKITVQK